jgi:class 3 adenylate cyclase
LSLAFPSQFGKKRRPEILVILLLFLVSWSCVKRDTLPIHQGQLDLSLWDPRLRPVLELAGEWEFAANTVLLPNQKSPEPAFIKWPKTWENYNQGYASYRLRLKLPRALQGQTLALFIPFQSTAMRVLMNGEKIFESGSFGTDRSTSVPSRDQAIINFPAQEDMEILVHISNFHHSRGGTWYAMKMGLFRDVVDDRFRRLIMDSLVIFMLLGLGLYFVFSYVVNRKPLSLAIGFTGLTNALRFSMTSSRLFEELIPLGFAAGFRLEYWSLYLLVQAYVYFAYLYLRTIFSRHIGLFLLICSLLVNAKVFLSVEFFSRYLFLAHILCLFAILYCFYISIKGLRKNIWGSVYIFYGSLTIFTASLIDIILVNILGNFDFYVIQYGSLAFLYMQAMAAGSRELVYLQKIRDEEEMRNHSYAQLAKIVYPHQMKMIQGGKILEDTMPTTDSEAVVISFDIIGSSRIQHEKVKKFLRDTFSRCTQVMMEGYDADKLQAPAYRIKEVGDGFLCSVGYPFRTISGSKANDALRLAYRFHEILKEEAKVLQSESPICCGIGMALDSISGFYPESGAKEYDVFGRSVILATRYEAMRKYILDENRESSIIILQSRVYESLDRELRDGFNRFDLQQHKTIVRDDSGAVVLYYKLMA